MKRDSQIILFRSPYLDTVMSYSLHGYQKEEKFSYLERGVLV